MQKDLIFFIKPALADNFKPYPQRNVLSSLKADVTNILQVHYRALIAYP